MIIDGFDNDNDDGDVGSLMILILLDAPCLYLRADLSSVSDLENLIRTRRAVEISASWK